MTSDGCSIQEAAEATGLSIDTLRYYDRAGLLGTLPRNANQHRRFTELELQGLRFIRYLRLTGMPIRQIARYMTLVREGGATAPARQTMLEQHRETIEKTLREQQACLEIVNLKIEMYRQGLTPDADHPCTKELACRLAEKE
jgi:DNA-binding transcriptional MerR regulator